LPSEDDQITTNYICRRDVPGGETGLKDGLTRNKGKSGRFQMGTRRPIMCMEDRYYLDPHPPKKTLMTKIAPS